MKNMLRVKTFVVGVAALALVGAVLQPGIALAEDAPPADLAVMGEYNAADYTDEAAALPDELVVAVERDLGQSAEQYLADADAAVQASNVLDSLSNNGIDVRGSHIDGTDLTVYVDSDAAASVVAETGATVVVGEPEPVAVSDAPKEFAADVYGGQGYAWQTPGVVHLCSTGFNGYLASSGASQSVTAGHCTDAMSDIVGSIHDYLQPSPGQGSVTSTVVGLPTAGTSMFGAGNDVGRITAASGIVSKPQVLSWGGGMGGPLTSAPLAITGITSPVAGSLLCHSGSTSGWSCGKIDAIQPEDIGGQTVNSIIVDNTFNNAAGDAKICVLPGDSGGPAVVGTYAVGITSWRARTQSEVDPSCATTVAGGFFPLKDGTEASVENAYGSTWELAVLPSTPTVGAGPFSSTFSGTLAKATAPSKVNVYFDGSSTPVTVTAASGSWSVPITSLPAGVHSYRVEGAYGLYSKGGSVSGYFAKSVAVDRLAGADRFTTAAAVAAVFGTASTVYVAYGRNYPDALSAAPAAAFADGPLLLTETATVPQVTADRLVALNPSKIVVVGGTSAVSDTVKAKLKSLVPAATVTRQAGANRYESSRLITRAAFLPTPGTTVAYIATGQNFPDALAASAAAGHRDAPVILVNGAATSVDAATKTLLADLGVTKIYVAGGTAVVSEAMRTALAGLPGVTMVKRLAGTDRYSTGLAINVDGFTTATDAYFAVGTGYADALAGAALAGATDSPLYVVPGTCVPVGVLASLQTLGVTKIHLLGGTAALNSDVFALKQC